MKKFKLKSLRYSFDHEGMIIKGEQLESSHTVHVHAGDIREDNIDVMSKINIVQCMVQGKDFIWRYELDELEPLEPIKLTRLEYEILKSAQKQGAKYICKDKDKDSLIVEKKPKRGYAIWLTLELKYSRLGGYLKNLFKFVKWEDEPHLIEDVLENYEIVED